MEPLHGGVHRPRQDQDQESKQGGLPGITGRPRVARFVLRRPELVQRVDRAMEAQVVLLRGPAGAGKTTVLADWADQSTNDGTHRGVWVTVEPSSDARADLWSEVRDRTARLAGGSAAPGRGAADVEQDLREIAAALEDTGSVLVLDDFDAADGAAHAQGEALAQDVRWLLRRCTALTVVLVSRARTVFETSGTAAGFDVEYLDIDELPLSPQEAVAALTLRGAGFDTAALQLLSRTFRGSPMAVFRVGNHLAMEGRRVWRESDLAPVLDRVRAEIALDLTEPLRSGPYWDALRSVAVLPYVTTGLAARVLGGADTAAEFLTVAERAGLGGWLRDGGRDRFVLSAVARRTLEAEGHVQSDEERAASLRFRAEAARGFAEDGDTRAAVRLAHEAGDWSFFSEVTLQDHAALTREDPAEVARLIDTVDAEHRESDAWLLLLRGTLAFALEGPRSSRAVSLFDRADTAARDLIKDTTGVAALRAATLRTVTLRRTGSFNRSTAMARRLIEMLEMPGASRAGHEALRAEAHLQAGISLLHDGAGLEALHQFSSSLRQVGAQPHVRVQAHGYAALVRVVKGDVRAAERTIAQLEADPEWSSWRHTMWAVPAQLAGALIAVERNDDAGARAHLRVVDHLAVDLEDWPFVAYVRGVVAVTSGAGYTGFSAIRDIEARFGVDRVSNHLQGLLFVVKSDLLLLAKQARPALAALRPFLDGRETVIGAQARALLFSGNSARARLFAERFAWRERLSPRVQMELAVVKAIASGRHEDHETAAAALERAAAIGAEYGLRLPWSLVPHDELRDLTARLAPDLLAVVERARPVFSSGLTVPTLTRRESIVLAHLRGPGAIEDIARDLMVSPNTVKTQVQSVYRKLGVKSRSDAVRVAFEWRLVGASGPAETDEAQYSA